MVLASVTEVLFGAAAPLLLLPAVVVVIELLPALVLLTELLTSV